MILFFPVIEKIVVILKAEYPETDPFLTMDPALSTTVDADKKLVPSGLFAYFSCKDTSLFLNVDTLDLDQDGMFGIQCIGGEWDLDSLPAEINDTCITTAKCKPRSMSLLWSTTCH